jgi:hypothetical protein
MIPKGAPRRRALAGTRSVPQACARMCGRALARGDPRERNRIARFLVKCRRNSLISAARFSYARLISGFTGFHAPCPLASQHVVRQDRAARIASAARPRRDDRPPVAAPARDRPGSPAPTPIPFRFGPRECDSGRVVAPDTRSTARWRPGSGRRMGIGIASAQTLVAIQAGSACIGANHGADRAGMAGERGRRGHRGRAAGPTRGASRVIVGQGSRRATLRAPARRAVRPRGIPDRATPRRRGPP